MILGILQARMSSSRLPGKVLKPIFGRPMLSYQIERIGRCKRIDKFIVATSVEQSDDPIGLLCADMGVECFRGALDDVLDRFYQASKAYMPDHVVRFTGDCPLIDPAVVDEVVQHHLSGQYDYTSNTLKPTFPDGLDIEVFRFSCLARAWAKAHLPSEREHVTPYIYHQSHRVKLGSYERSPDLSSIRLTVDENEDFLLVRAILTSLYPRNPYFGLQDILDLLESDPTLADINAGVKRNERFINSMPADRRVKQTRENNA